jgi:predicted RNase H-like nuclease/NTP pyrophosphatase (non-canonical NTP hydrolase)
MGDLERLVAELRRFAEEREWGRFHDPKNLAMAVVSEAGELAAELRWIRNEDADAAVRDPARRARVAAEIADVAILLLLLCDRAGIDLETAVRTKLAENRRKYPADRFRGRAEAPAQDAPAARATPAEPPYLAGVDACRDGWVIARAGEDLGGLAFRRVPDLESLFRDAADGRVRAAIDMPIGLPDGGRRRCDVAARRRLGTPRAPSVFDPPCRGAIGETTWTAAAERNRKACGRGLTRQAFALLPRIREIDDRIAAPLQEHVREAHPEVTFAELASTTGGLRHPKATAAGRKERLALLRPLLGSLDLDALRDRLGREAVRPDDVLDAAACLVTAHRLRHGRARTFPPDPPERDARGLRMEIVA